MTDVAHQPPTSASAPAPEHVPLTAERTRAAPRSREPLTAYASTWASAKTLSIVVPTRNEAGNIEALLDRLAPVVNGHDVEIIFVDDSTDDTPDVVAQLRSGYSFPVHIIHREPEQREGGLGGAVLAGMRAAQGHWIVVMDGDLQHPPECIPNLINAAEAQSSDLIVASRYCANGETGNFSQIRSLVSHGSTIAAKLLFPRRLHQVDDPMSGFFLVRRGALDLDALRPNGFKILLEIVGRTPGLRIGSVPFRFGERFAEQSKASFREGFRFLQLLFALRLGPGVSRFGRFGLVGVSGLVINSLLLAFWTETIGIYYLASLILATQGSSLWNFALSERWVFQHSQLPGSRLGRCARFMLMNNAALLARGPMVFTLTSLIGINYLLSNIASMTAILILRYAVADSLIWKRTVNQPHSAPSALPVGVPEQHEVAA